MKLKSLLFICLLSIGFVTAQTQRSSISGTVTSNGNPIPFSSIYLQNGKGTNADENGSYTLDITEGTFTIIAQSQGFKTQKKTITVMP